HHRRQRLIGLDERGLRPHKRSQVARPLLDRHHVLAAPVHNRRWHRRGRQQRRNGAEDIVLVDRVVRRGLVRVHGNRLSCEHLLEMHPRPAAVVAVRNVQPRNHRRKVPLARRVACHGFGRDLVDRVRRYDRHHAVAVAQLVVLSERPMTVRLVDGGGRTMEERLRGTEVVHQEPKSFDVGREIVVERAGLGYGHVDDIVGVGIERRQIARREVDRDAPYVASFEFGPSRLVVEPRDRGDRVLLRQGQRYRSADLASRPRDYNLLAVQLAHRLTPPQSDFFTEVWTVRGLVTYYAVFLIELYSLGAWRAIAPEMGEPQSPSCATSRVYARRFIIAATTTIPLRNVTRRDIPSSGFMLISSRT